MNHSKLKLFVMCDIVYFLVREILFLSGKIQGVLKSHACGNHELVLKIHWKPLYSSYVLLLYEWCFFFFQDKKSPLHLAAANGRTEVCKVLLDLRADASVADSVSWVHSPSV